MQTFQHTNLPPSPANLKLQFPPAVRVPAVIMSILVHHVITHVTPTCVLCHHWTRVTLPS